MYIDMAVVAGVCLGPILPLLPLPIHILIMIRKRHIEIKRLVPLPEAQPDKRVLPPAILDPQHEVPGGVEGGFDGGVAVAGGDEAGGEEGTGGGVLESDLGSGAAGDNSEAAGPDLIGLEPVAALVAAGGGAGRDLEDGDLADDEESVLEGLIVVFDLFCE